VTDAPPDMVAGARQALLAIMRARRPDLSWEVGYFDGHDTTNGTAPSGTVRSVIGGHEDCPCHEGKAPVPDFVGDGLRSATAVATTDRGGCSGHRDGREPSCPDSSPHLTKSRQVSPIGVVTGFGCRPNGSFRSFVSGLLLRFCRWFVAGVFPGARFLVAGFCQSSEGSVR